MTDYTAKQEQWAVMERWAKENDNACCCILELRARVEALEAQHQPTDKQLCETYLTNYNASKNRQGPNCQAAGLRAVLARWGR